jgi:hypothetical protein
MSLVVAASISPAAPVIKATSVEAIAVEHSRSFRPTLEEVNRQDPFAPVPTSQLA